MKNLTFIIVFLLISTFSFSQQFGVRTSATSKGLSLSIPVATATKGSILTTFSKETDRHVVYVHYTEQKQIVKNLYMFGGAGIQFGSRNTLNWKRDANTIFLAGVTGVGGIKYSVSHVYISADFMPRVDAPLFGGCEMHRYCSESKLGSVNLSVGVNLK